MGMRTIRLVSDGENLTVYADGTKVTTRRIRGPFDFEVDKAAAEMAAECEAVERGEECCDDPCA